jgi:hypothetical protein
MGKENVKNEHAYMSSVAVEWTCGVMIGSVAALL